MENLSLGGERQREVYEALRHYNIFARMAEYEPVLIGSIPLGIAIESSDVDIICYYTDMHEFITALVSQFGNEQGFRLNRSEMYGLETETANFIIVGLQFEIFGQNIPIKGQLGYSHMLIEETILRSHGESFRSDALILFFITESVVELIIIPIADNRRRDDFLDNSLGSRFALFPSVTYYDNDEVPVGLYKVAVNLFENCFFTHSLVKKATRSKILLPAIGFVIIIVFSFFGFQQDAPMAMTVLQWLFHRPCLAR